MSQFAYCLLLALGWALIAWSALAGRSLGVSPAVAWLGLASWLGGIVALLVVARRG